MKKNKKIISLAVFLAFSANTSHQVNAQVFEVVPSSSQKPHYDNPADPIVKSNNSTSSETQKETIVDLKKDDDNILFVQDEETEEQKAARQKAVVQTFATSVQMKDYEKIQSYLSNGANINTNLYDGNTIVTLSAFHRDIKLLTFAAEKKANLSALNNDGESIIYWGAAGKNLEYIETIKSLMSAKDFDSLMQKQTKTKRTPLHAAVLYAGNKDIVEFLLNNKVSLEAKDNNGQTALHYAAALRRWDILELLLKKGGNIKEVDAKNESVEQYIIDKWDLYGMEKVYPFVSDTTKRIIESRFVGMGSGFIEKIQNINPSFKPISKSELN